MMGVKIILDIHDLMPEFYASRFRTGLSSLPVKLVRLQEWLSCCFADRVITVSEWWQRALVQRGLSVEKSAVVMNVADSRIFNQTIVSTVARDPNHFQLIYHGTITHRYGLDLVLQAVAQARAEVPELRLIIHGRGEYLAELEQLAAELQLNDIVNFSSALIPIEELPQLIASADLGVVPYRRDIFTDGILPTKLMEYAALGLPAIVARTPANETYFDDTMVEFFEAENVAELRAGIVRLSQDKKRLAELAHNIILFSHHHGWAKERENYLSLVASLTTVPLIQVSNR
jgi:glycosyltransferase involved in cell wall biosynthesis